MTVAPVARTLVALALACVAASASAQYVWLDNTRHKVFSDRPPPMDIPERNILKQPGAGTRPIAPAGASDIAPPAPAAAPKPPGKDGDLEEKRKQAQASDDAKRKSDEARQAAARADNCARAQQSANSLGSGMRIAQVDASGERSYMDDQTRAAELQRVQSIVASDCR